MANDDGHLIPTINARRLSSTSAAGGASGARSAAARLATVGRSPERTRAAPESRYRITRDAIDGEPESELGRAEAGFWGGR
jgi:hypothetical protein